MSRVLLRARAICRECDSRLPPRTEALQDDSTGDIFCLSCAAFFEEEAFEPEPVLEAEAETLEDQRWDSPPAPAPTSAEVAPSDPGAEVHAHSEVTVDRTFEVASAAIEPAVVETPPPVDPARVDPAPLSPVAEDPAVVAPAEAVPAEAQPAPGEPSDGEPAQPEPSQPEPAEPAASTGRKPLRSIARPTAPPRTHRTTELERRSFVAEGTAAVDPDLSEPVSRPRPRLVEARSAPVSGTARTDDRHPNGPRRRTLTGAPTGPATDAGSGVEPGSEADRSGLFGRLRPTGSNPAEIPSRDNDAIVVGRPDDHLPAAVRGDHGDTAIGRTLESARIHGIEVLHRYEFDPNTAFDHVVVGTNGVWVIRTAAAVDEPVEKSDVGDWFTSDLRLKVGDQDRTDLVDAARADAEAIRAVVASSRNADVPVRPVLCFAEAPPRSEGGPFTVAGVLVTWRNRLVEPLVDPVLLSAEDRAELVEFLQVVRFR